VVLIVKKKKVTEEKFERAHGITNSQPLQNVNYGFFSGRIYLENMFSCNTKLKHIKTTIFYAPLNS
jgi:hypothetical protein